MKRKTNLILALAVTFGLLAAAPAQAFDFGIGVDVKVGLFVDAYQPSIKVPDFQSKYKVRDPDMEMLLALKPHTKLSYEDLWKMRLKEAAWWWVIEKLGIKPDVVLPKFKADHGPPYGNAYGYWRNQRSGPGGGHPLGKDKGKDKGKSGKGQPQWSDTDLVDLVRVNTLAKLTGKSPDEVVKSKKAAGGWDKFCKKTKAERGKSGKADKGKSTKGNTAAAPDKDKSGGGKGKSGKGKSKK